MSSQPADNSTGAGTGVTSTARIVFYSLLTSFSVLVAGLIVQFLVYHDWLHRSGSLRIVGSTIAALITFAFVLHWQTGVRQRQLEALQRFEVIAAMNDRIRNALQAIECLTYASNNDAAHIREAVEVIDVALRGVVAESSPPANTASSKKPNSRAANGQVA